MTVRPLLPFGRFAFSLATNYLRRMILTQMEVPSLHLGQDRWWREQRSPVCCWQGHSSLEVFILDLGPEPWAEPGQNKWCTEREWEVIGINSSVTVSRRGLGLVTQRRGAGAHHAVAENVRDHYPKETE